MTGSYGQISSPYRNLLIAFWVFALFYCVTSLPVQFLYRYLMIVKELKPTTKQYTGMLGIAFIAAFGYASMSFIFLWPSEEVYAEKAHLLLRDVFYFHKHLNFVTGDIRNWKCILQAVYASLLVNISYGIVIYTSFKVWKYLKRRRSHMSTQTREIHRQMTKALIIQALIPFLVCMLPIGVTIIMVLLFANIEGLGIIISLILAWIPVVNSLTTIIIVKSYRRIVFGYFKSLLFWRSRRHDRAVADGTLTAATNTFTSNPLSHFNSHNE